MSRALSRLARVAGRLAGAGARAGPRLALRGLSVASGTLTRLRICGGFRAHRPACAQASPMEGAFEIIRNLLSGWNRLPARHLACRRGRRHVRLLATGSEESCGAGILA